MIKLFISYRRVDGTHAAQRVRACMQAKFGADAVFIDRDIPPGADWAQYLGERLEGASDVVVLVGDAFLRELRRRDTTTAAPVVTQPTDQDWLRTEIETALQLNRTIYPVIIGRLEMPDRKDLPESIRGFAALQAVYAREPAFDAAMAVLGKTIAGRHGWIDPPPAAAETAALRLGGPVAQLALWLLMALLLTGLTGRLVRWLATGETGTAGGNGISAWWLGAQYLLLTLLWGLGPYLVYRSVAEVRARAQLPVLSPHGLVTMVNVALALLAGGSFLLLSTRADFVLRLPGLLPPAPGAIHYALQGALLLAIVFAAVVVAMLEPVIRGWRPDRRRTGLAALMTVALVVLAGELWLADALLQSMPQLRSLPPVPMVGYFMLAPSLSGLVLAWDLARSTLGLSGQAWHSRALFALAIALYLACTLGYFAHGPVRLFVAVP